MSPHAHGKVGMLKNDYSCRVALETKIPLDTRHAQGGVEGWAQSIVRASCRFLLGSGTSVTWQRFMYEAPIMAERPNTAKA